MLENLKDEARSLQALLTAMDRLEQPLDVQEKTTAFLTNDIKLSVVRALKI
jgi:hypothetical protein